MKAQIIEKELATGVKITQVGNMIQAQLPGTANRSETFKALVALWQ